LRGLRLADLEDTARPSGPGCTARFGKVRFLEHDRQLRSTSDGRTISRATAGKQKIAPHIAQIKGRSTPGLDTRTTRHASYAVSQRKRKRVEEIFGWMKAYGGLRRTLVRGLARVQTHAYIVGAA
jgi:hypothetical protein